MKASRICLLVLFLLFACISFINASRTLEVMVKTDKPTYLQRENVTISGNVILDATPHPNSLVALWVENPNGSVMIPPITVQTDKNGDFNFVFKLPKNAELGIYEAYTSTRTKNKNATNYTTFGVKALTQPIKVQTPGDQRILTIVIIVTVLVALGVMASGLVFLILRRPERGREPPAVPREDKDERYKKCIKCGRRILWFRAFCPYCYSYQARSRQQKRGNPSLTKESRGFNKAYRSKPTHNKQTKHHE